MYVCMYVCICVYECMFICVCMYLCTVRMYVCVYIYICVCVCMYVCMYVCMLPSDSGPSTPQKQEVPNFPLQPLWMDQGNQKPGAALRVRETSQVPHNTVHL